MALDDVVTEIKKAAEPKKTTPKKLAPSPITAATPSNDEFDAIFGGVEAKKATVPSKSNGCIRSAPKAPTKTIAAAPNDAFDAIFGKDK